MIPLKLDADETDQPTYVHDTSALAWSGINSPFVIRSTAFETQSGGDVSLLIRMPDGAELPTYNEVDGTRVRKKIRVGQVWEPYRVVQ